MIRFTALSVTASYPGSYVQFVFCSINISVDRNNICIKVKNWFLIISILNLHARLLLVGSTHEKKDNDKRKKRKLTYVCMEKATEFMVAFVQWIFLYIITISKSVQLNLDMFNYFSRITTNNHIARYIFCHHCSRSNNRIITNRDTRIYNGTSTNPNVITNRNRLSILCP